MTERKTEVVKNRKTAAAFGRGFFFASELALFAAAAGVVGTAKRTCSSGVCFDEINKNKNKR